MMTVPLLKVGTRSGQSQKPASAVLIIKGQEKEEGRKLVCRKWVWSDLLLMHHS